MSTSRALSFGAAAAAYARHRPGYPHAAVEWALQAVTDHGPPRLLDLGAGTGKLTESLLPHGTVTAVDPDPAMLRELQSRFPDVDAREGSAESIPVADGSVDAVLVGQAWHWFDLDRAWPELARVVRPGGVLAVVRNEDDRDVEWVAGYHAAARQDRPVPGVPAPPPGLPEHPAFRPSGHSRYPNPVRTTVDGLIGTLGTHSWALLSEPPDREAAFARIRAYLATRPETSGGEFELPLITEVLRALRR